MAKRRTLQDLNTLIGQKREARAKVLAEKKIEQLLTKKNGLKNL
jgi:hypothetical protein